MKRYQYSVSSLSDSQLVERLSQDDKLIFNYIIECHYKRLCQFALKYVRYEEPAEEIVQDVFVSLWVRRHTLKIESSLSAYLFTAVKYCSINYQRKEINRPEFHNKFPDEGHPVARTLDEQQDSEELERLVAEAIKILPAKCRVIFDLSRNAGLTYKEIAKELDISIKTVETQISIAISRIKSYLTLHWDKVMLFALMLLAP